MAQPDFFSALPRDQPFEVPFVPPIHPFDGGEWSTFPVRAGWNLEELESGTFFVDGSRTPQEVTSFLQQWLVFGLLGESHIARGTQAQLLVVGLSPQQHISMSKITTLLSEWVSSIAEASQPAREAIRNRLNSLATAASPYILSLSSWMESPGWPVPYEISLSIFSWSIP
jgi:hypothetical protein